MNLRDCRGSMITSEEITSPGPTNQGAGTCHLLFLALAFRQAWICRGSRFFS